MGFTCNPQLKFLFFAAASRQQGAITQSLWHTVKHASASGTDIIPPPSQNGQEGSHFTKPLAYQ
jgi:hypothetical protein